MEPNPSPEETETPRRRRRAGKTRHPHGRAWVFALWIALRVGDLPLAWLAFRPHDPTPQLRVPIIVCVLWTTALFVALWARQNWARYLTAAFLGVCSCWWGYNVTQLIVILARRESVFSAEPIVKLLAALELITLLLYAAATIAILRSKDIKYLTDSTAGWRPREF